MIIWSRWGILVFVAVGLSVGMGFLLKALIAPDVETNSSVTNVLIGTGFLLGAAGLWAFCKYALPKLDKGEPMYVNQKLAEPIVDETGARITHRAVAVVNQETGEQVWSRPSSSFFFIPMRFFPYLLGAVGLLNIILGVVGAGS